MRLSRIILTCIPFISGLTKAIASNSDVYQVDTKEERSLEDIYEDLVSIVDSHVDKRSDSSRVEQLEKILLQVNESGIIMDVLNEIAGSKAQQNTLVNMTTDMINNGGGSFDGIQIDLNTTNILNAVKKSGIINSTLDGLLLNDENREILGDRTGHVLSKYAYVSKILADIGNGQKPTVEYIANTVKHFKTKNPKYQYMNEGKQVVLSARDDEYSGSAQAFLNNLINTVVSSDLVSGSAEDFLIALNRTGIAVSIAMEVVKTPKITEMGTYIIGQLYANGVFDNLDTNKYFQDAKKKNILSDGAQTVLTDPTYSPALAKLFQQMENNGVFADIQKNLYGHT
ncbi:DEHA2E06820p [Debaryomyces hansenii CBS767]|uniref:DEHA2E06820p n=1 Tax=Debaryomyces hansenii (strain ATCC 36239 / CBS 767 / BCRC 21394 / JCM 1990 / NBRC 0083 / IGC 2968) TaxID=284592 RepID=Q6BQB5_DEBHA|nr:DEHA2E06820p [Debaryomyces hansenii CBS767]CAG87835.2 DEHA2E06820p [Debaryomyces hansenii CBS767]|eukprot:XP_459605.2 DEHA2E06820p [Debaryomyces hansenii CBS767]